jgi:hypothetical protein
LSDGVGFLDWIALQLSLILLLLEILAWLVSIGTSS